jgi:hypothetical protein
MRQASTTTRVINVATCVVLVFAGLFLTYHFARQSGYNAGRAAGRVEGAKSQVKKDAIDKDAKNWAINQHIWDANTAVSGPRQRVLQLHSQGARASAPGERSMLTDNFV